MLRQQILAALTPLVGQRLLDISRAVDMRMFGFGELISLEHRGMIRLVSPLALHVQCPWRIEGPAGIVTGRADLWEPADPETVIDDETWCYDTQPNLQDKLLQAFFIEHQAALLVIAVDADDYGGAVLEFANSYKLRIFPAGTTSEDWRIFGPGNLDSHFVISGGEVIPQDSE